MPDQVVHIELNQLQTSSIVQRSCWQFCEGGVQVPPVLHASQTERIVSWSHTSGGTRPLSQFNNAAEQCAASLSIGNEVDGLGGEGFCCFHQVVRLLGFSTQSQYLSTAAPDLAQYLFITW
jgi:hypothetical protein